MSVQPTDDTDEMCRRIMYVLLHKINLPQTIEFNKDVVWEAASSIPGVFKEYGLGLKDTVFQALVQQQDIVDLGETVRITDQGVRRPENQPPDGLFVRDRSLLAQ
jgi:hypothetical protein